ncbi:Gfo/Idh/MocA family oxidoreductase [Aeromicrobium sp.]|uniref:Gfo/Idh/MocA family oxidoreductase n=1 Tax=Aeromicrobium sp. TaxID=1871063 RepID=UPI003D6B4880
MRVITYGTFDLFHDGHRRLLERARSLGDHLIVAVTTENFDDARGKLNVQETLMDRIQNVQDSGLADEVIIEEYEGQKINDIQRHHIDIFAIGSDWLGKFDYLKDYCEVVYLERTKGISSTQLRNENAGMMRLGVVGTGRIANRFVDEAHFVSGIDIEGAWSRSPENVKTFVDQHDLDLAAGSYEELLDEVDSVYIATPHVTHVEYALAAMERGKHVLCEKPMSLTEADCVRLQEAAEQADVVLLEAVKTAFSPGFQRLVAVARSGSIGDIRSVDATFTKLTTGDVRELDAAQGGGSLAELASYPLLAVVKLLGEDHEDLRTTSFKPESSDVELYSRIDFRFPHAVASARTGLGVKAEGDLVIAGTRGYIYVPAPWWKTEYFEVRFENQSDNKKFYYKFDGDGLRYEIAEFGSMIRRGERQTFRLRASEMRWMARVLESARTDAHVFG